MDTAQDIIQAALDLMGKRVELLLNDGSDLRVRFATIVGVRSPNGATHLRVEDYTDGHEMICRGTVIMLSEIIDIREAS